jgi:hypothetical protein
MLVVNVSFHQIFPIVLILHYLKPFLEPPLRFRIIKPSKCIGKHMFSLINQILAIVTVNLQGLGVPFDHYTQVYI